MNHRKKIICYMFNYLTARKRTNYSIINMYKTPAV